jgi:hypothetical protein
MSFFFSLGWLSFLSYLSYLLLQLPLDLCDLGELELEPAVGKRTTTLIGSSL